MSEGVSLVYALFPDADVAHQIARAVTGEQLAACVNIMAPCTSLYEWQGEAQESTEVPALFKTSDARAGALVARIAELHPYEVPAILSWDTNDAHPPFAEWVGKQVQD
jgi:periplasmic divalent cation tolerance protein